MEILKVKLGKVFWSFSATRAEKTQYLIKYLFNEMEQEMP